MSAADRAEFPYGSGSASGVWPDSGVDNSQSTVGTTGSCHLRWRTCGFLAVGGWGPAGGVMIGACEFKTLD